MPGFLSALPLAHPLPTTFSILVDWKVLGEGVGLNIPAEVCWMLLPVEELWCEEDYGAWGPTNCMSVLNEAQRCRQPNCVKI